MPTMNIQHRPSPVRQPTPSRTRRTSACMHSVRARFACEDPDVAPDRRQREKRQTMLPSRMTMNWAKNAQRPPAPRSDRRGKILPASVGAAPCRHPKSKVERSVYHFIALTGRCDAPTWRRRWGPRVLLAQLHLGKPRWAMRASVGTCHLRGLGIGARQRELRVVGPGVAGGHDPAGGAAPDRGSSEAATARRRRAQVEVAHVVLGLCHDTRDVVDSHHRHVVRHGTARCWATGSPAAPATPRRRSTLSACRRIVEAIGDDRLRRPFATSGSRRRARSGLVDRQPIVTVGDEARAEAMPATRGI